MALTKKLVVLASGRGSNFCALADAIHQGSIEGAEIVALISNKANARAMQEAQARNIPHFLVESKRFKVNQQWDRNSYEKELLSLLKSLKPDFILLAGYMLVLGKQIIQSFPQQIINIHPSLLPKFRGLHAQKQALVSGETETGCTVHWVTEGLDEGDPILQGKVPILTGDTEETLSLRLLPVEHQTYIAALKLLLPKS
jgi:phosphoribosylglycinamide formyltransferase 1